MPAPSAASAKINWRRRAALVLLAPLLALGILAIGLGSVLLLVVEWVAGGTKPRPIMYRPAYDPAFDKLGERPAI